MKTGKDLAWTTGGMILALTLTDPSITMAAGAKRDAKGGEMQLKGIQRPSFYWSLPSDQDIPELNRLLRSFDALPDLLHRIETPSGKGKPVNLAIHERGYGTNSHVVVAIHGILSSSRKWNYVVGALGSGSDYWLVDLPGCGDSDRPAPDSMPGGAYNPTILADRVLYALQKMLNSRNDWPRITLIAHSFGGLVALRMQSDPDLRARYAGVLDQIDEGVMFAPADIGVHVQLPALVQVVEATKTKIAIGSALGMLRDVLARVDCEGHYHTELNTRESVDLFMQAFVDDGTRRACQAMILQAVPGWEKNKRPNNEAIRVLEKNYANIKAPQLIVWGECDTTLPEWMGHKIKDHIPGASLVELPDCMHSPHAEVPERCAQLIRGFRSEVAANKAPAAAATVSAR